MYKVILDKEFVKGFQQADSNILLSKWNVEEKKSFRKGGPLFFIETEKALFEITASQNGYLKKILLREGELLGLESILAVISDNPDDNSPLPQNINQLPVFPVNLAEEE